MRRNVPGAGPGWLVAPAEARGARPSGGALLPARDTLQPN